MPRLKVTVLGCGSSGGVPRVGGHWGNCDPNNPKNLRRRCSLLLELIDGDATTRVLIDTSPDLRMQLLDAGVGQLDGVIYTHAHADHVHGIDDLRMVVFNRRSRLPVWADLETAESLQTRFEYVFLQPANSSYVPILDMRIFDGPFAVDGAAGELRITPIRVAHGRIDALAFRIGGLAYLPDVSMIPDDAWSQFADLDVWILDALRYEPHPTHTHFAQSLEWIARVKPKAAVLTNMHNDLDYERVMAETPDNVIPAYDGLILDMDI